MSKKEISAKIKVFDYTIISKSWHKNNENNCVTFTAYDEMGTCHIFFIDFDLKIATRTRLSAVMVHEPKDVSGFFF